MQVKRAPLSSQMERRYGAATDFVVVAVMVVPGALAFVVLGDAAIETAPVHPALVTDTVLVDRTSFVGT
jgi:uncharacterized sodium:solute symporter family permease YidK